MFHPAGSDIALAPGQTPGKFDLVFDSAGPNKGNPRCDGQRQHAAFVCLMVHKRGTRPGDKAPQGGYYYDSQGVLGSRLWTVTQDRTSTRGQLVACIQDAGQQLVSDRYATAYTADATRRPFTVGQWAVFFGWTLPSGEQRNLVI